MSRIATVKYFSWSEAELFQTEYAAWIENNCIRVQRDGYKTKATFDLTLDARMAEVVQTIRHDRTWQLIMLCFPPEAEFRQPYFEDGIVMIAEKRDEQGVLLAGIFVVTKQCARLEVMQCHNRVGAEIVAAPGGVTLRVQRLREVFYQLELVDLVRKDRVNCQLAWQEDCLALLCDSIGEVWLCRTQSTNEIVSLICDPNTSVRALSFGGESLDRLLNESDQGHRIVCYSPSKDIAVVTARRETQGIYLDAMERQYWVRLVDDAEMVQVV